MLVSQAGHYWGRGTIARFNPLMLELPPEGASFARKGTTQGGMTGGGATPAGSGGGQRRMGRRHDEDDQFRKRHKNN